MDRSDVHSWTKEEENKAYQLLNLLELHEESQEFLAPVDYKKLNIPMYPMIIKIPMDLGTIKKRVKSHNYRTLNEFIAEVQLVWDNCKKYNEQITEIHQQAVYLEKQTKRYCLKLKIPLPNAVKTIKSFEGLEENKTVSFEEKWKMTEMIKKVNQGVLDQIVGILNERQPEALENLDGDKMKIKLDLIGRESFRIVQNVIDEFNCENLPQKRLKKYA